jgi:hypothetical protein
MMEHTESIIGDDALLAPMSILDLCDDDEEEKNQGLPVV